MSDEHNGIITYNVDDYGVLRVYRGKAILFEAQDFSHIAKCEIEDYIDEVLFERGEQ